MQWHMGRTEAVGAHASELRDIAQIPLELQDVLQLVQDLVMVGTEAAGVAIALGNSEAMHCVSSVGEAPLVNIPVQLNNTLSGHCVRTGKIVSRRPSRKLAMHQGQRPVLLAPVFLHSSVVGLIGVFFTEATPFGTACRAVIRHAARLIELCMLKLEGVPKLPSTCEIGWGKPLPLGLRLTAAGPMTTSSASPASTPSPERARHLLGLPCRVCGTYLFTDEVVCRVCKTANDSQLNSAA